jgi:hypothetical protein
LALITAAKITLLQHCYIADAVIAGEIISGRHGMATAADYHNIVMTFEFLSRREVMPGRINLTESILEETKRHAMTLI